MWKTIISQNKHNGGKSGAFYIFIVFQVYFLSVSLDDHRIFMFASVLNLFSSRFLKFIF